MNWFTWTPLELAANFFTVVCIVLAGRNSIHTWWTGIIGAILYGIMFFNVQLYADATLQVFFIATGLIGWANWKNITLNISRDSEVEKPISSASTVWMTKAVIAAVVTAVAYGTLLHSFTDAYAAWIDSTVLAYSVVAQLLLMGRYVQTWHVWLLVNTLSVPLFWSRELYLTSIMYGFFWCNAVYSLYHWKQLMKAQK